MNLGKRFTSTVGSFVRSNDLEYINEDEISLLRHRVLQQEMVFFYCCCGYWISSTNLYKRTRPNVIPNWQITPNKKFNVDLFQWTRHFAVPGYNYSEEKNIFFKRELRINYLQFRWTRCVNTSPWEHGFRTEKYVDTN